MAACGGGGDDDPTPTGESARGSLRTQPQTVATLSASDIEAAVRTLNVRSLTGQPRCDVRIVALDYNTVGVSGEATTASGALLVPGGACAAEQHPLLAYARGTTVEKPRTMASVEQAETLLLAAFYAAQGYAVVATDYLGYAKSSYAYHPYLHADSQASSVIDALRAARAAAPGQSLQLSGKVMLAGYSQGGHASAATQRAIERDNALEFNVVAAAHMAGPYNLSGAFRDAVPVDGYQVFVPFVITSWQKVYGNLYSNASQVFKAPYATGIEGLLPSATQTTSSLVSNGALPGGTPAEARDALLQPGFLADVQANDANPVYQAARRNDLLGWSPRARTLLCGGSGDPTVPPRVHQAVLAADFTARGVSTATSVDVDPQIRAAFARDGQAPTDPASDDYRDYFGNYHGVLQPPFCLAEARRVFEAAR